MQSVAYELGFSEKPPRKNRPAWVRVLNSARFRAVLYGLTTLWIVVRLVAFFATVFWP